MGLPFPHSWMICYNLGFICVFFCPLIFVLGGCGFGAVRVIQDEKVVAFGCVLVPRRFRIPFLLFKEKKVRVSLKLWFGVLAFCIFRFLFLPLF